MAKKVHASATLIENENGEILILLRDRERPEGKTWGLVGGEIEEGEEKIEAAKREISQEIGANYDLDDLSFLETFHWDRKDSDITLEVFRTRVKKNDLSIKIQDSEADEYQWITPEEAYKRKDLMEGLYPILERIYKVEGGEKMREESISIK